MVFDTLEDGTLPPTDPKPARKWRDKLFSKDKDRKTRDEQVDDFLSTSRPDSQSQSQSRAPPRTGVPAPRIDVTISQRWPDPNDVLALKGANHHSPDQARAPSNLSKRRRRRSGLKVTFSNRAPEVIGEGGEEAEDPTQDVLLYRARSNSSTSAHTDGSSDSNYGSRADRFANLPSLSIPQADQGDFGRKGSSPNTPTIQNAQDSDFLLSIGSPARGSRLSWRPTGDQDSLAQSIQQRMRAEEGRALQNKLLEAQAANQAPPTDLDQERSLSPEKQRDSPPSVNTSRGDRSPGLSFWSNVLSSLPDQDKPERQDNHSSISPPATNSGMESHSSTSPPPYLQSGSKESSFSQSTPPEQPPQPESQPRDSSSSKKGLRSIATMVGNTAMADFASYVDHYNQIFSLAAESVKPSMETSLTEWVRASVWWFLKGRSELEAFMRSRSSSAGGNGPQSPITPQSQQAVVDLAKSWWINQHIVPSHPELQSFGKISTEAMLGIANSTGNQKISLLIGLHLNIISHLRALAMSMKRNNVLPPTSDRMAVSQGIDTTIWVKYPFFAPGVSAVLSGSDSRSMLVDNSSKQPDIADLMPMGDNSRYFSYGRMFVSAYISSGDDDSEQYAIPCMLSITRDRTDWHVIATITSQNELVNIVIQSDKKHGPTWADVKWQVRACSLNLRLPRGFELDLRFKEPDFKMLWKIVEYTRKVEGELMPEAGEDMIFEDVLNVFQYMETGSSKSFPPEPTKRCRLRVFERKVKITEGTGTRNSHRGYRLIAVTSPKVKTLSSVSHVLGDGAPIVFGYLRGDDGAPAMMLKVTKKGDTHSMLLTFQDPETRSKMHSLLLGITPGEMETKTPDIPLKSFSIEQASGPLSSTQGTTHLQFSNSSAAVISSEVSFDHGYTATILSESLRVFVSSNWGSVTDRINLGPGDLKLKLDMKSPTTISVLRPPQNDLGVAVAENLVPPEMPGQMTDLLKIASSRPITRKYDFASLPDLHQFQEAITGFKVLFDGPASIFAISRRRMVVPIYKKWEATTVRLQIIQQEKVVQLVAFFSDFSHGKCMNFVIKSTDNFESFNRAGKYGIKIVDAKFALPKSNADDTADYICLDMPEYPGEHDDIMICFDSEKERFGFQSAIPGSVREPSRMSSMRK